MDGVSGSEGTHEVEGTFQACLREPEGSDLLLVAIFSLLRAVMGDFST